MNITGNFLIYVDTEISIVISTICVNLCVDTPWCSCCTPGGTHVEGVGMPCTTVQSQKAVSACLQASRYCLLALQTSARSSSPAAVLRLTTEDIDPAFLLNLINTLEWRTTASLAGKFILASTQRVACLLRKKAITSYCTSGQILPFVYADQCCSLDMENETGIVKAIDPILRPVIGHDDQSHD